LKRDDRAGINPLTFINELLIVVLETLGIFLVAAGLGFLAGLWIGWIGLAVSGAVLLIAAGLSARQQRSPTPPPTTGR
jgi:hypothetical protein